MSAHSLSQRQINSLNSHRSRQPSHSDLIEKILETLLEIREGQGRMEITLQRMYLLMAWSEGEAIPSRNAPGNASKSTLSQREHEVFNLIGLGYTPSEIAKKLFISTKTVGAHFENIKNKLSLDSIASLRTSARRAIASQCETQQQTILS